MEGVALRWLFRTPSSPFSFFLPFPVCFVSMDDYEFDDSEEEEYVYEDSSDDDDMMGESHSDSMKPTASSSGVATRTERLSSGGEEFKVLSREQLGDRMNEVVEQLVEILCLSYDDAMTILRHYKWNSNRAQTEWFDDQDRVRDVVGLPGPKALAASGRSDVLGKRGER